MSKYFLKEQERYLCELVSSIDGEAKNIECQMKPISRARQLRMSEYESEYAVKIVGISDGKLDKWRDGEELPEDIEAVSKAIHDATAEYHFALANEMFEWTKEKPTVDFFKSEDFEHVYFLACVDFFLEKRKA